MSDSKPRKDSSNIEDPTTEEPLQELTADELDTVAGGLRPAVPDFGRFKSDYTPQRG